MRNTSLYELKIHEFKFSLKKLEIHKKIHNTAAEKFSDYFKEYIYSLDNAAQRHKLKQVAGLASPNEPRSPKTAQKARQQRQYRQGKNKVNPSAEQELPPIVEVPKREVPKEYKNLYRKIANATHPDKVGNDEDKKNIFQEVNSAVNNEDYFKLIEVAMELDLEIPEEVPLDLHLLDKKITSANSQIKQMTKTIAWEWYHVEEEETKRTLIKKYAEYLLKEK